MTAPTLPSSAIEMYEGLRATVCGPAPLPVGVGAVVYHGMVQGLGILLAAASPAPARGGSGTLLTRPPGADAAVVRVLANMLLHTQSEGQHVY